MRTARAVAIFASVSGLLALNASAEDVPHKYKRYKAPPSYAEARAQAVCDERARHEDPTGVYAGQPCWAREAFARGTQGGRGRR